LFHRGDPSAVSGPRAAIVGTRSATRYGVDVAFEFGRDLAAAGVAVVSGLALGIDGAAHAGALAADTAAPIAVVGSGLDVVYPKRHAELWREVVRKGVVLSESPLGAAPEPWRFPARNRLIAALADVVVVVESQERGGSMHTVAEAQRRDRPVFAVPGPVRSAASAGTNRLLREGALAACDVGDVLIGLGLSDALRREIRDPRPDVDDVGRTVLDAINWQPVSLEQLAIRTEMTLGELSLALARLQSNGWVDERGGWYERVARSE
jgi:DNA processing protein